MSPLPVRRLVSLQPTASPGEVSAPAVWAALTALLIAFGVDPARAAAIAGMAAALAPYIVKAASVLRRRQKGASP